MKNPNALIAMAQVAQNADNPYATFCEYIKYCLFANAVDTMTLTEVRDAVGKEFGLYMPHNVLLKCLMIIQETGVITFEDHKINRKGFYDTENFDKERDAYRETENAILQALILYVSKYNRVWTEEYARGLLTDVLDRNGLAYDIFIHKKCEDTEGVQPDVDEIDIDTMLPDDEEIEAEDADNQPLFSDQYFVGRFIESVLSSNTIQKKYLQKICEGLMLCVGTYQLPTAGTDVLTPQIAGTSFFFDTKLLLRFLGCAGDAAVAATKELVSLIQDAGGNIYYYPQTLEETNRAFDKAITSLSNGDAPYDDEMRMYASRINSSVSVVSAKKANWQAELASHKIYLKPHDNFTEAERIRVGFDRKDLLQYMQRHLSWDYRVIENDALAIWETHMHRQGNYNEYCGTNARLPVFVTSNSRLIGIALKYRENRPHTNGINGWRQNRLPVITDMRLTCRLWSPAAQSERMSLLYLTANAVAAKRPTRRYINSVRELATQLGEQVPEYSGIALPAYFDDNVTESILESTLGMEENLNISSFASTITELTEFKAKEQEEVTKRVMKERDDLSGELKAQERTIIDSAVEVSTKLGWWNNIALWSVLKWHILVSIIFAVIGAGFSFLLENIRPMLVVAIPVILKIGEVMFSSSFVSKSIAIWLLPGIESAIDKRITKKLRMSEVPYKDKIIRQVKEKNKLWVDCDKLLQ